MLTRGGWLFKLHQKGFMKRVIFYLFFLVTTISIFAQNLGEPRSVVVLAIEGKAFYGEPGKEANKPLKVGQVLHEGTSVRADRRSKVDLFLRQIGTTIRLTPMSLVTFEKLGKGIKNDVIVKDTQIHLERGEMYAYVRVLVPDTTFKVRNRIGTAAVPGAGIGRYRIGADGSFYAGQKSPQPLRVTQLNEATAFVVKPGEVYRKDTQKVAPMKAAELEDMLQNLDELQGLATNLTAKPAPNELPKSR